MFESKRKSFVAAQGRDTSGNEPRRQMRLIAYFTLLTCLSKHEFRPHDRHAWTHRRTPVELQQQQQHKRRVPKKTERRREQNRESARRHYYKTLQSIQVLRAQEAALERRYEFYLARFDQDEEKVRMLEELSALRSTLVEENRALRESKEAYLAWQDQLKNSLAEAAVRHKPVESDPVEAKGRASNTSIAAPALRLQKLMTVDECHAIAQLLYKEIRAFTESEHFVTSGMSAFGWTDRRREENGQLKFSLQKTFPNQSAYVLMARTWSVVSSPRIFTALHSPSMKMRCELVQTVDHSNVVIYQEYLVRERDTVKQCESISMKRCLLLHTFFETATGYAIIFCSLDPERLVGWPGVCGPTPGGVPTKYDSLPSYSWMAFEREGATGDDCKISQVGRQDTSRAYWAIEMLQVMLRWERGNIGPVRLLPNDMDWAS